MAEQGTLFPDSASKKTADGKGKDLSGFLLMCVFVLRT